MIGWKKGGVVVAAAGTALLVTSFVAPNRNRAFAGSSHAASTATIPGFFFGGREPAPYRPPAPPALDNIVQSLGRSFNGQVGIAVQSVDQGWTVSYNGASSFPQQSVSKLWVSMAMLDAVDRGKLTLQTPVVITPGDLTLFNQPIASLVTSNGYASTVGDLSFRAMTQSDNTANDSVLRTIGGPSAVRAFLARRFVDGIRFGPGERLMQSATAGMTWSQDLSVG
ncbi:MAG: serine hydrolase, partial [Sphingobium sp.]